MQAQTHPPGIEWTTEDFYPFNPPFPTQAQVPQTKDNSNEDWWYNHKNVYESGVHTGYIAVGYSSFSNYFYIERNDGCILTELQYPGGTDCIFDDYPITGISPTYTGRSAFQFISRKDLYGHDIWTKVVNQNWFQNVIQTTDGGFLAVGITASTREPDYNANTLPQALVYNPGLDNYTYDCPGLPDPTPYIPWHINAVKFDINGNILWNRLYGNGLDYYHGVYDVCEYEDANGLPAYRLVCGIGQNPGLKYPLNALVVDLKTNGDANWIQEFPSTVQGVNYGRDLYGIAARGTGTSQRIVAVGRDEINGAGTEVNVMMWEGANTNYVAPIERTENFSPLNDAAYDVSFRDDNHIIVGVTYNSSDYGLAGGSTNIGNIAEGYVSEFPLNTGIIGTPTNYPLTLGIGQVDDQLYAYDLKVGVTTTADGGFAAVSSKRPQHYTTQYWDQCWTCNNGPQICTNQPGFIYDDYWNTDAFVKKFALNGTPEWEITFDENSTEPPEDYPGDFKKQECMYGITEAEDGGFVISGNYSSNFDDAYLAKLYPNCQNNLTYDYDGYDNGIITPIDASTLPNPLTGTKKILGILHIPSGTNFTIDAGALYFADSRQTGIPTYIHIQPGGQLNVQGNTILDVVQGNGCDDNSMWDGIEVWGDPNGNSGFGSQGVCYIQDGATITNARIGVMASAGQRDGLLHLDPRETDGGGYIRVTDANFINNRRSIHYAPYYNGSTFNFVFNSNFINGSPMRDKYYEQFVDPLKRPVGNNTFISDYNRHGLLIDNNQFSINYAYPADIRGTAVGSYDARVIIKDNTITDLTTGIEMVDGSAVLTPVSVVNNEIRAQYGVRALSGHFIR
ncbi:MAG: hypothetical protein IPO27_16285 [Bacteroidetes bacterium]|nr:hypothetical protein [Bacteroidota bacterium]